MYIIIGGGGNVGHGLALELRRMGDHEVTIVERDAARATRLRAELGEMVVQGDGSEIAFLESVGAGRADLVVAVSADDGANLVTCQVARHWFGVGRTIARVNDQRNEALFVRLGIDSIVSAAAAVLAQIEATLPEHTVIPLMALRDSGLHIVDMRVQEGSPADGRRLSELSLPTSVLISIVVGAKGAAVPDGSTVLHAGDEVIAVMPLDADAAVRALISARPEEA